MDDLREDEFLARLLVLLMIHLLNALLLAELVVGEEVGEQVDAHLACAGRLDPQPLRMRVARPAAADVVFVEDDGQPAAECDAPHGRVDLFPRLAGVPRFHGLDLVETRVDRVVGRDGPKRPLRKELLHLGVRGVLERVGPAAGRHHQHPAVANVPPHLLDFLVGERKRLMAGDVKNGQFGGRE